MPAPKPILSVDPVANKQVSTVKAPLAAAITSPAKTKGKADTHETQEAKASRKARIKQRRTTTKK